VVAPQLLHESDVDLAELEAGRDAPDVAEGQAGELAAPAECKRNGAEERAAHVAGVLRARETLVRPTPDALGRVRAFRFADDFVKENPDMAVEAVGITIYHIRSVRQHCGCYVLLRRRTISNFSTEHLIKIQEAKS